MLVDREGLWFRVLATRYGVERGHLCAEGTRGSWWWREIVRIRDGGGEVGEGGLGSLLQKRRGMSLTLFSGLILGLPGIHCASGLGGGIPLDGTADLIWHSQVPLKVSILAWRLLRDRLPTKVNLITRGILPLTAQLCVSGCGEVETAQHLFLSCSMFGSLWSLVSSWIGSPLVTA
ncbi:hypothetical protein TSUD_189820 [Trifolium subterraneum]|uniref:Reverse transcriptase zinc-binding domain-containing protein n=1 Tax=Trifolium subterraneum TaxID=3900 RepID=A0A2Z6NUK5_TRISU|nr:hypothetical protein TSUD_189820 [Trifolium subterraneum]